jgi:tetratricopeptide (TPR) repeat protein
LSLAVLVASAFGCAQRGDGGAKPAPDTSTAAEATPAEAETDVGQLVSLAESAAAAGDADAAIAAYRAARKRQPWNPALRQVLAAALSERASASFAAGDYAGARAAESDLREAVELEPEDATLRRSLGTLLVDLGSRSNDPERRAALFAEAAELGVEADRERLEHDPGLERRLDLAMELVERGQLEAATLRLESLHRERPDNPEVALLLSQVHARRGLELAENSNMEQSALAYEAAWKALGGFVASELPEGALARAHRNRVVAWSNAGQRERAVAALRDAEAAGVSLPDLRRAFPEAARAPDSD